MLFIYEKTNTVNQNLAANNLVKVESAKLMEPRIIKHERVKMALGGAQSVNQFIKRHSKPIDKPLKAYYLLYNNTFRTPVSDCLIAVDCGEGLINFDDCDGTLRGVISRKDIEKIQKRARQNYLDKKTDYNQIVKMIDKALKHADIKPGLERFGSYQKSIIKGIPCNY